MSSSTFVKVQDERIKREMSDQVERQVVKRDDDDEIIDARFHEAAITPIMKPEEIQQEWDRYRHLENSVLQDDDYIYWVEYKSGGKVSSVVKPKKEDAEELKRELAYRKTNATIVRRKTKSAYRKMARFFGLFIPDQEVADVSISPLGKDHFVQVEKGNGVTIITYLDESLSTIKVEVNVAVVAPHGQTSIGVATCSADERRFTHPDHDVRATAWTRAVNRAISDMVGWGEVSAEEMLDGGESKEEKEEKKSEERKKEGDSITLASFLAQAFELGWTAEKVTNEFGNLNEIGDFKEVLDKIKKVGE